MVYFRSTFLSRPYIRISSKTKVDKINTDSKELRVDVGIDGNLANYDLISLEKLANHFTKIEKDNEHGMVK